MPLTAEEKNRLVELGATGTASSLGFAFGLSSVAVGGLGLAALPLIAGIQTLLNPRQRAPALPLRQFFEATDPLVRRGLAPVVFRDPFTGATAVSTADQSGNVLELLRLAAERKAVAGIDFSPIAEARQRFITGLEETAVERGFASTIDPTLRGGVFRETADSPLRFIEGEFL